MPPTPRITLTRSAAVVGYGGPPDLFVLVRPPPSLSTHPLNLQVQLLVPSIAREQHYQQQHARQSGEYSRSSSRNGSFADEPRPGASSSFAPTTQLDRVATPSSAGTSAVSFDAIAGASVSRAGSRVSVDGGEASLRPDGAADDALRRIPSGGSTRSRGSTNSMSARSDATSATGTRRRVTPLLNLSFHSVLPTVVTDAGTDQRVGKFLKRGIELSGFAIIDPLDLSQPPSLVSTRVSRSPPSSPTPASAQTPQSAVTGPGNLFAKFKKLTFGAKPNSASPTPQQGSTQQLPTSPTSTSFFSRSTSTSSNLSAAASSPSKFLPSLGLSEGAPTPRTVPLLRTGSDENVPQSPNSTSSATPRRAMPPSSIGLPSGYAFVVRKWLRDDLVGISEASGAPTAQTQIRIEWIRASDQEYRRLSSKRRGRTGSGSGSLSASRSRSEAGSSSRRSSDAVGPPVVPEEREFVSSNGAGNGNGATLTNSPDEMDRRNGADGGMMGPEDEGDEDDAGDESDPEDSERPWICTLYYPSSTSSTPASTDKPVSSSPPGSTATSTPMRPNPSTRRLQLATLRPAPHHPKLIATLLLPPTLPSVPLGTFTPSSGLLGGVLSNETLRDLVHVSAMWLSIREGLGGLNREKDVQNLAAGLGLVKVKSGKVGRTFRGFGGGTTKR
ncbi:hypothetical protein JCM10212_003089 [Sporobolomyces blumeae]